MNKKVLIVVDYQNDFANPNGALYVPEAETIVSNIQSEINNPDYTDIIYTMDTHIPAEYKVSEEAKMFPEHCIFNTEGWKLYNIQTRKPEMNIIINYEMDEPIPFVSYEKEFVFLKDKFSIWEGNSVYKDFILNYDKNTEFYIVGVATNYCVFANAMGYRELGYNNVFIIEGAVKGIKDDSFEKNIEAMKSSGISFVGGN